MQLFLTFSFLQSERANLCDFSIGSLGIAKAVFNVKRSLFFFLNLGSDLRGKKSMDLRGHVVRSRVPKKIKGTTSYFQISIKVGKTMLKNLTLFEGEGTLFFVIMDMIKSTHKAQKMMQYNLYYLG